MKCNEDLTLRPGT